MKSKEEIRRKLTYYEGMLASVKAAQFIDSPEVFLTLSHYFPNEALGLISVSAQRDKVLHEVLAEDQEVFAQMLDMPGSYTQQVLTDRVSLLKWVLEGG